MEKTEAQVLEEVQTRLGRVERNAEQMYSALCACQRSAEALFDAIKHGDAEHQAWLREAIRNHFDGKPIPPVRPTL